MSYPGQKTTSNDPVHSFTRRIITVFFLLLWAISLTRINPARADGGGPQPTNTTLPGAQIAPIINPTPSPTQTSLPGAQSAPSLLMSTPEVKSFNIIIDSNQNATIQPVTPANQSVLSQAQAQATSTSQTEEFASPLWVFGFFAIAIIILVLNSVSRGFRSRE